MIVTNPESIDDPELEVGKPIKKATKSSKSRPQSKFSLILEHQPDWHTIPEETKAPLKRTKKPRDGTSVVSDSVVDTPTGKASKMKVDASEKNPLKVSTKKIIPNAADDDIEDDIPLIKSKAKGKAVNKTKPMGMFLTILSPSSMPKVYSHLISRVRRHKGNIEDQRMQTCHSNNIRSSEKFHST